MKIFFRSYQKVISPFIHSFFKLISGNPYTGCRFEPTCSCYAEQAIQKFGFLKGGFKAVVRITRCHPFSGSGGYDPV